MTTAYYQAGEAEAKLDDLYAARGRAMSAWDATAFNCLDREIQTVLAVMYAEERAGLREPAYLSFPA
jgi:hypothetical protein